MSMPSAEVEAKAKPAPAQPAGPVAAPQGQAAPAPPPPPPVPKAAPMVVPLPPPQRAPTEAKPSFWNPPPKEQKGLTEFQRTAYRVFGNVLAKRPADPRLAEALMKSRTGIRPEALQSAALMSGILGGLSGAMMALFFLGLLVPLLGVELPMPFLLLIGASPLLLGGIGYVAVIASPGARAKARAKDIDTRLPYALNYIAAMASAGVNIDHVFKSLAEQKIYGEVAREAEAIYRDIRLFGKDEVTAFKRAIARTPSQRFAELLQGAITTFSSGGDLEKYFSAKAQRYMLENRQYQKQFLDTMGLMAETYVTTAVAGPLFLMVMMAIMGLLQGAGPGSLYLVTYLMLPFVNFGFVYGLMAMTPKV